VSSYPGDTAALEAAAGLRAIYQAPSNYFNDIHIMLCISQKQTVRLLYTQPRSNTREEYYLCISGSFFGSGLLRLCLGLCICFCFCFCRSLCLDSRLSNAPQKSVAKSVLIHCASGTWKLTCFIKIKNIVDRDTGKKFKMVSTSMISIPQKRTVLLLNTHIYTCSNIREEYYLRISSSFFGSSFFSGGLV
jgi:hypothetical protein